MGSAPAKGPSASGTPAASASSAMGREAPYSLAAPSSRLQGSKGPSLSGQSGAAPGVAKGSRKHRMGWPEARAAARAASAFAYSAGSQGSSKTATPRAGRPSAAPPGSGRPAGPPSRAAASCAMMPGARESAASGTGAARAAAMGSGASACTSAIRGAFCPRRILPQGPGVKRIRRQAPSGARALIGRARQGGVAPPCQAPT